VRRRQHDPVKIPRQIGPARHPGINRPPREQRTHFGIVKQPQIVPMRSPALGTADRDDGVTSARFM
jgi:hypothetical protein